MDYRRLCKRLVALLRAERRGRQWEENYRLEQRQRYRQQLAEAYDEVERLTKRLRRV